MTYISSQSLLSPLRQSILQAQAQLSQAQTEVSTGVHADLGLTLGAQTGTSLSLTSEIDQLNSYSTTNSLATTRLDTSANALSGLLSTAQSISASLLTASSSGGTTAGLQASAKAALQGLIGGLNSSVGGQFVFAGINTAAQPVNSYDSTTPSAAKQAVDGAFSATFGTSQTSAGASTITASAMSSFLDGSFQTLFSDANWSSDWSSASNTTIKSTISPSNSLSTSVSANGPAFRQIAQAYTMLSEFTGSTMSADAQSAVVAKATTLLNSGIAALTDTQSTVGVAQAAVSAASTSIAAQVTVIQTNVDALDSVNTYDLSNQITSLKTQLEASYSLTSSLQQLSLVNYLHG